MSSSCYHCGEPVPKGVDLSVCIEQIQQVMCCIGCQAVAQTIVDNNLTEYYRFRTEPANKGAPLVPEQLQRHQLLDDENLQHDFIYQNEHSKEAILTVDGISCAACAWLIEMQLSKLEGLISVNVNATTQRAQVKWADDQVKLSEILSTLDKIGYHALPFKASTVEEKNKTQSKAFIKRLGISGILMMQVMMIAIGLYFGAFSDMSDHNLVYLRWASFLLTIPVVSYGAFPFYQGAFNTLKLKRLSMDVPVSIAIILSFIASGWATISQQGEVYFESVSMFTFLLLVGKFLEFRARARAAEVSANLLKLMPMTATKLDTDDDGNRQEVLVSAKSLQALDRVMIKPGEVVPADGIIVSGQSQLNEAMLSGEQLPLDKSVGDKIFAGTINGDGNLIMEVKQDVNHSFLSQLIRLSESTQAHKPKLARLSDQIAQYFVAIILLTAIGTAYYWHQHMPHEAFWITLSVLVATCPCALSLATPTALTCATTRLNRDGIMVKSGHVMETLPKIDCYGFDKTGTLTTGEFEITRVELPVVGDGPDKAEALKIAAALEAYSQHPLAKPFVRFRDFSYQIRDAKVHPGAGISGVVNDTAYRVGKVSWLLSGERLSQYQDAQCVLMAGDNLIAAFYLEDKIREDALTLISGLNAGDNKTMMLSGDSASGCESVARQLPLDQVNSGLSAEDKMAIIKGEQQNHTVVMIGDGVNDTPVFGAAHVSIAMGSGTDVAKSGADVILLSNRLSSVATLKTLAIKTRKIIFQNYAWAFGYNAIVLPLAVAGLITPYMAVIGMSASSILVITNSLRLLK
ncbi:cadmium-translocating P-type ATPase [Thalassomonas viridans]|uniref:Cadmium-translocating P-type ATPase n=1 Tax=Thalassomonas viridans TaxID=137584 RepID=A0AAE9Z646_9GAMM|nr:heavy metal translocating P-type ATPase [Thalassomonas viridans]WDE07375.1 cadmium-translocating P-type ATPase [Thalassomonas viridans]